MFPMNGQGDCHVFACCSVHCAGVQLDITFYRPFLKSNEIGKVPLLKNLNEQGRGFIECRNV